MIIQKWQVLLKKDVSPHKWFPLEFRTYKLPDGKVVEDFSVTTIGDVSMTVLITKEKKVILVRQYKPGVDDITLEFPAGRLDEKHTDFLSLAQAELEEEAGIHVERNQLQHFAVLAGFTTKGSERVNFFLARDCVFNSRQNFDQNENIEVVCLSFQEMDKKILSGKIWTVQTIAGWYIANRKFPEIFS